mmetsp:Transcript_45943/g.91660  ORF Transcript_45943/g.91660 Transcript_45943/m.91660 type:complete len:84 (+) Transcript_45943:100-351(+)
MLQEQGGLLLNGAVRFSLQPEAKHSMQPRGGYVIDGLYKGADWTGGLVNSLEPHKPKTETPHKMASSINRWKRSKLSVGPRKQ